jgi:uncharacterized protein (TIGR03435 family)
VVRAVANENYTLIFAFHRLTPESNYENLIGTFMKLITLVLGTVVIAVVATQAPAQKPRFEVASIEPIKAKSVRSGGSCHGKDSEFSSEQPHLMPLPPLGRCVFKAVNLHYLVRSAYAAELQEGMDDLITNEPSWMRSELFDVNAVAPSPETARGSELYAMLQTLLADRFKLRLHRDHKEVQGYALLVAKTGPKLKPDTSGDEHGSLLPSGSTPFEWEGKNVALSSLASSLSGFFGAPVVDKTGLAGRYDFTLSAPRTALIFEALQDQLGLRLQEEKESVVVLVIDCVQRPRTN